MQAYRYERWTFFRVITWEPARLESVTDRKGIWTVKGLQQQSSEIFGGGIGSYVKYLEKKVG